MKKINLETPEKKRRQQQNKNRDNKIKIETTFYNQETLFGLPKLKKEFKLCENYKHLLGIFSLNPDAKLSKKILLNLKSKDMHSNTIKNFLIDAKINRWIEECNIIQGAYINTLFYEHRFPDTFEDGTICKDKRENFFKITDMGIKVFEVNEKYDINKNTKEINRVMLTKRNNKVE